MSSANRSLSASDPSHQTIDEGFVKRADSSTQHSSGVDTAPPRISFPRGTLRGPMACTRRYGYSRKLWQGKILGHRAAICKRRAARRFPSAGWYTSVEMYARKLRAEIVIGAERRAVPLDWLDSFCMRNFTGAAEFDDTLPTGEGRFEAGLDVDLERVAAAMSAWPPQRGKR